MRWFCLLRVRQIVGESLQVEDQIASTNEVSRHAASIFWNAPKLGPLSLNPSLMVVGRHNTPGESVIYFSSLIIVSMIEDP